MKLSIRLKFCADCEEVFENGNSCPACSSRSTDFVSRWIPPMFWKGGSIDETVKLTTRNNPIQEDIPNLSIGTPVVYDNYCDMALERELDLIHAQETYAFNAGYECGKEARPQPEPRKVDSLSRVIVEKLLGIVKECYRPHASSPSNLETSVDKGAAKGPRDKSDSGYKDPKNVHKRELNFE